MSIAHLTDVHNVEQFNSAHLLSNGWPKSWIADDPDWAATSPEAVYRAAIRYVEAGMSVIPIDAEEPSKSPDPRRLRSWKQYQLRLPRQDELRAWYERGGAFGLAVLGGEVSGGGRKCGLEIIDFDSVDLAAPWIGQVEARLPGLTNKLVMVLSPRPGLHVYYRCSEFGECQKLACAPIVEINANSDNAARPKKTTLIELKGEGGYCLVPPSPRRCHPRNGLYQILDDSPDLTQIPVISKEERTVLLEEARRFNRWTEVEPKRTQPFTQSVKSDGNRPGDDFARRTSWAEILEPFGWVVVGQRGDIEDWCRPGKNDGGISGTTNYANSGLFYVFSTNAYPFEEAIGYSKFHAYALLNHGEDYKKAAKALQDKGFGRQVLPAGKRVSEQTVLTTVLHLEQKS